MGVGPSLLNLKLTALDYQYGTLDPLHVRPPSKSLGQKVVSFDIDLHFDFK